MKLRYIFMFICFLYVNSWIATSYRSYQGQMPGAKAQLGTTLQNNLHQNGYRILDIDKFIQSRDLLAYYIKNKRLNINQVKDQWGRTLLHRFARANDIYFIDKLIEAGADINAVDSNGWTPIYDAIIGSALEAVVVLVNADADLFHVDNRNRTPIELVKEYCLDSSAIKKYFASLSSEFQEILYPEYKATHVFIPIHDDIILLSPDKNLLVKRPQVLPYNLENELTSLSM